MMIKDHSQLLTSLTRPTSGNNKSRDNSKCNTTCRINFIEHNKQRIKLMSANSKTRPETQNN